MRLRKKNSRKFERVGKSEVDLVGFFGEALEFLNIRCNFGHDDGSEDVHRALAWTEPKWPYHPGRPISFLDDLHSGWQQVFFLEQSFFCFIILMLLMEGWCTEEEQHASKMGTVMHNTWVNFSNIDWNINKRRVSDKPWER